MVLSAPVLLRVGAGMRGGYSGGRAFGWVDGLASGDSAHTIEAEGPLQHGSREIPRRPPFHFPNTLAIALNTQRVHQPTPSPRAPSARLSILPFAPAGCLTRQQRDRKAAGARLFWGT